jgi:hypothetical protein
MAPVFACDWAKITAVRRINADRRNKNKREYRIASLPIIEFENRGATRPAAATW